MTYVFGGMLNLAQSHLDSRETSLCNWWCVCCMSVFMSACLHCLFAAAFDCEKDYILCWIKIQQSTYVVSLTNI